MASITLKNIKKDNILSSNATYVDLHLDMIGVPIDAVRDIMVDTDLDAIKNSLSNLFSTSPGQKLLNPNYGMNLINFLFEPVTNNTANIIGETILNGINRFEPRVSVEKIYVSGNSDTNEYDITLLVKIPSFPDKDSLKLNATLSKNSSFTFL